jgi:hypothetical protein
MPKGSNKHADFNQFINLCIQQNLCIWEVSADLDAIEKLIEEKNGFDKRIEDLDRKPVQKEYLKRIMRFLNH